MMMATHGHHDGNPSARGEPEAEPERWRATLRPQEVVPGGLVAVLPAVAARLTDSRAQQTAHISGNAHKST